MKQIQLKGCSHIITKHKFFKPHGIHKINFMGTNVKSVCLRILHEIMKKKSNIVASMNSTVIYSYLSRKWIRTLPSEQNIKNFSQRKTLHLLSRLAGTDCDISTKPRVLRAALYNISIRYEWRDSPTKSAPSLKSVLFGHNETWFTVYGLP